MPGFNDGARYPRICFLFDDLKRDFQRAHRDWKEDDDDGWNAYLHCNSDGRSGTATFRRVVDSEVREIWKVEIEDCRVTNPFEHFEVQDPPWAAKATWLP